MRASSADPCIPAAVIGSARGRTRPRHFRRTEWLATTTPLPGSWWPVWEHWLAQHSAPDLVAPPALGAPAGGYPPLADAPGAYVLAK